MAKCRPKNWIVGRWLIESMEQWDRDFIDEEARGYFEFDRNDSGDFQFGYVQGQIDYRLDAQVATRQMSRAACPTGGKWGGTGTTDTQIGITEMAGKERQTVCKPATKFAHLRKKMEKARPVTTISKKKK